MLTYIPDHDILINSDAITKAGVAPRTDWCSEPHVVVNFVDGTFTEFPPDVSLYQLWVWLAGENA